jgi:glycosyltransferase involved in cell wall biosynthesis
MMDISVIIPVFNRATIVERTLNCVLAQKHRPIHLILVDNNSSDATLDVLNKFKAENESHDFRITVAQEEKPHASAARNCGMKYADTEWIMFFDSDDVMDEELIEKYATTIESNGNNVDLVCVRADMTDANGIKRRLPFATTDLAANHILHSILATQLYAARKSLVEKAGGWNETLPRWNDWELGVRIMIQNPRVAFVQDCVPVHAFRSLQSITGANFSSNGQKIMQAIDIAEADIRNSDTADKARLLKLIEFKRINLAGLFAYEGNRESAEGLYKSTYSRVRADGTMRWLYPLLYKYIGIGGIGATRIVHRLIK